jgi:hypothetical protein
MDMLFRYIIWTVIFYLLIRFIFNFIIPVFRASRQMREQVRSFQQKQHQDQFEAGSTPKATETRQPQKTKGDYIDFEELK